MKTIPLTKGKVALVDDADFELIGQFKWHAVQPDRPNGTFYAARRDRAQKGRYVYLHRVLLGLELPTEVDHRDGDGLNNQRCNLRVCDSTQNRANQRMQVKKVGCGFKGVTRGSAASGMGDKWIAYVESHGRRQYLGYFTTAEAAAAAYDTKAVELFGEFARTNKAMGLYV